MMMTSLSVGGEMSTQLRGRIDNRSHLSPCTMVEDCTETLSKGMDTGNETHTLFKGIDTKREKSFPDSGLLFHQCLFLPIVPVPVYICLNRSYMPTLLLHTSIPIL